MWKLHGIHSQLMSTMCGNTLPIRRDTRVHPEGTSKNSDNCDFLKVSDIVKSIVVNGEKYI